MGQNQHAGILRCLMQARHHCRAAALGHGMHATAPVAESWAPVEIELEGHGMRGCEPVQRRPALTRNGGGQHRIGQIAGFLHDVRKEAVGIVLDAVERLFATTGGAERSERHGAAAGALPVAFQHKDLGTGIARG